MERSSKNESMPIARKASIAFLAGMLATSTVVGCSSREGKTVVEIPLTGGSDIPYGIDCVNQSEHWQQDLPAEDRGAVVDNTPGVVLYETGAYGLDNYPSSEVVSDTLASVDALNGDLWTPEEGAADDVREGYKILLDSYSNPNRPNTQDVPSVRAHPYGNGGMPQGPGQEAQFKVCLAWNDESDNLNNTQY